MTTLPRSEQLARISDTLTKAQQPGPGPGGRIGDPHTYDADIRLAATALEAGADPAQVLEAAPSLALELAQVAPGIAGRVEDQQLRQRWRVLGVEEMLRPTEPPSYLVDGLFRMPSLACLFGPPGDLKSMLAMDLMVSVASGQDWLPRGPVDAPGQGYRVHRSPCLWFDADQGEARLRERFGAMLRTRNLENKQPPLSTISLPSPPLDLGNAADAELLRQQMIALGTKLLVIDNLGVVSGGKDENTSAMVAVMASARYIAESTSSVVIVIHHSRKPGGQTGDRLGDRIRGHSSIAASLDLALAIEKDGDCVTLRAAKSRDEVIEPFKAVWHYSNRSDGALVRARFHYGGVPVARRKAVDRAIEDIPDIVTEMERQSGYQPNQTRLRGAIRERHGVSDQVARRAIERAVEAKTIIVESAGEHRSAAKSYRRA